jgi:hypothetical protein
MAKPPPQDEKNRVPENTTVAKSPTKTKNASRLAEELRTSIDDLHLKFPPSPTFKGTENKTEGLGQSAGGATIDFDQLKSLNLAQKLFLLEKASLKPNLPAAVSANAAASGDMPALILSGGTLELSHRHGVHFAELEFRAPPREQEYTAGSSYAEFESSLQRQCVTETKATVGMPGIFKVDAAYNSASSRATHDKQIRIFVQASRIARKAEIIFVQDNISLAAEMVTKIEQACGSGTNTQQATRLLDVLEDYGHFVPMSIFMGGRLTLFTSTELNDHSEFNSVSHEIRTAAKAQLESGSGAGATGGKTGRETTTTTVQQASQLLSEVRGGDPSQANSQIKDFGTVWQTTVGPYHRWATIGYGGKSLLPTIDVLPNDLSKKCQEILRKYFISKLVSQRSEYVGTEQDTPYANHLGTAAGGSRRFAGVKINHGRNVDGLQWWYESSDGSIHEVGRWIGAFRGEHDDIIPLAKGEELISIEVGILGERIQQLAFETSTKRYPGQSGYYGRDRAQSFKTITAPRVTGLFGWKGDLIYSIGFEFQMLANDTKSREFLLAMEPFLFSDQVYDSV